MTATTAYALYRRSRAHQDLSVEEQRESVRAWAAERRYQIVREFADDASGLDTGRRREFLALLEIASDPRRREASVVLCYDISRFSRLEPEEAAFHEYSLRRTGVRVVYTHEPGANEAGVTGQLVKALKRVLAHDYSQKLSQVVRRGLRAHAERGQWVGGRPPYGYRRAIRQPDGTVRVAEVGRWKAHGEAVLLVVEPLEAAIVRELYDGYATQGVGVGRLAARLNARGVPPPTSDRRVGRAAWGKSTVWAILRNPVYRGALVYAKAQYSEIGKKQGKRRRPTSEWITREAAIPLIVPDELWHAAQAKHGTRKFGLGRRWDSPYLLSGLIVCGSCGKHFWALKQARGREPAYYVCGGYVASGSTVCDGARIPLTYLDEAVLDGIQKRLARILTPTTLRQRVGELLRAEGAAEPEIPALEARLVETGRKIDRLVEALASGPEDLPSVRAALASLEAERSRLEGELTSVRAKTAAGPGRRLEEIVDGLLEPLHRIRDVLAVGTLDQRKAVVRSFLAGIRVEKATQQAILRWYRLPRDLSAKLVELRGFALDGVSGETLALPARCWTGGSPKLDVGS